MCSICPFVHPLHKNKNDINAHVHLKGPESSSKHDNLQTTGDRRERYVPHSPLSTKTSIRRPAFSLASAVPIHTDNTFLYTSPPTAIGFWFALEPCVLSPVNNGCLSFLPGSHKKGFPGNIGGAMGKRFVRVDGGRKGTGFEDVGKVEGERDGSVEALERDESWRTETCDAGQPTHQKYDTTAGDRKF